MPAGILLSLTFLKFPCFLLAGKSGDSGDFHFLQTWEETEELVASFFLFLPKVKEDILFDKFFFQTRVGFVVDESDLVRIEEDVLDVSRRFSTCLQTSS